LSLPSFSDTFYATDDVGFTSPTIAVTGGTGPVTLSVSPVIFGYDAAGLSATVDYSARTLYLSGMPSGYGSARIDVSATDANGATVSGSYVVQVNPPLRVLQPTKWSTHGLGATAGTAYDPGPIEITLGSYQYNSPQRYDIHVSDFSFTGTARGLEAVV